MGAIYRREIGAFFTSSIAYVFLSVFYILTGFFFFLSNLSSSSADLSFVCLTMFVLSIFLIPLLTMRLFSEEKKQKTEQGLLTAPVSLTGIVLGKYFAALTVYTIAASILFLYGIMLSLFGTVAWLTLVSNFIALLFVGAAFIAVGLFISALTENQVVAAIGGMAALLAFLVVQFAAMLVGSFKSLAWMEGILRFLSFYSRYYEFTCGIFNLSSVLFFISVAVLFNFFTVRVFEKRRWS